MGQKVHPYSFRLGYIKDWTSRWFAKSSEYAKYLQEDIKIRKFIKNNLHHASVSKVEIEKTSQKFRIIIYTARPGVIIGRRGTEIDRLKEDLENITAREIFIDIKEVKNPSADAQLIAENVAFQLEKRVSYRRAMKRAMQLALGGGALEGVKISIAGRLGGTEMSRRETYKQGKVPLQTIRADIDYGFIEAQTTYGTIGIKVWVYKGDILLQRTEDRGQKTEDRRQRT